LPPWKLATAAKRGADTELEVRQKAVEAPVSPLRETLHYRQQVEEMEKARTQTYGAPSAELRGVAAARHEVEDRVGGRGAAQGRGLDQPPPLAETV
jgi:hypothetical protein